MSARFIRGAVTAIWGGFFVWLLVSGEVYRYIGPRTQWVVFVGAATLIATTIALWRYRAVGDPAMGALIMLLPIVAVFVVPEPSLGSLAASRKLSGGAVVSVQPLAEGEEISFPQIEYASQSPEYAASNGILEGTEVELTGFVTHRDEGSGDFSLTRFSIFCCAADVVPHSVDVVARRDYPSDRWLTIRGTLENREGTLVVVADQIRAIREPSDPYLR